MLKKAILLLSLSVTSFGYSKNPAALELRHKLEMKSDCQEFATYFWAELHQLVIDQKLQDFTWDNLQKLFKESKSSQVQKLESGLTLLAKTLGPEFWQKPDYEQAEILAQVELGILYPEVSKKIKSLVKNERACITVESRQVGLTNSLSVGAKKVMSVAYQSCEAPKLSAVDQQTSFMQGVSIIGDHVDNIGKVRKISSLPEVQKTHPYLRIQNKEMGCFPTMEKPLIYDYGGKPSYRSASGNEIDLFKNAGSGGAELGIDCSAFVIASLGIEGLRLNPNEDVTARNTAAFGTSTLIHSPDVFSCLDYVSMGLGENMILSGDIITIRGHVVIVDDVGNDPLGLSRITTEVGCDQISTDLFDFRLLHSSPAWGSVGISRVQARDYLKSSSSMSAGILKYAKNHCKAKFKNHKLKPKYNDVSIVRHKKTPACLGRPLRLQSQECVKSCLSTRP